ncbi:hypothetical protein M378DRAFT_110166 [Amanita muscaria Koide BX008]|uniref:N-acetyltransferase domain-containing protein n=1 Tax=Amanita muscaria (strain Koide BX008) TaxID=946122 RepID=A0A0C2SC76_AMAMK|nr:hypothetical protein M378DRAFT_110166 [Amanita muscaria Koide BX008]
MSSPVFVYERATEIPAWVIDTLKRHSLNANIILPQIEKSRQNPPDASQLWIVYAPNRKVEYVLSVTESIVDSYPVFIFTTKKQSTLTGNKFIGQMNELADELYKHVDKRRAYSVYAPRPITTTFCGIWSKLTGIPMIKKPYYDAHIRRCTRQTFIKTQRQPVGYEWDMRLAKASDRHMVADLCKGFSEESEPFLLDDEEADLEAEYLIDNKLVWIYMIREPGKPNYEMASIAACTRNMEKVGTITKVYTAMEWRGKGCAGQLTAYVCEKLFAAGKESLVLYVGVDNPARRVYDKVGFVGVDTDESLDRWCEIGFDREHVDLGHW